MMAAKLLIPRNIRRGMQIIRNIKLILLSFHDRFLNFSENIGISDTSSPENNPEKVILQRQYLCRKFVCSHTFLSIRRAKPEKGCRF